MEECGIRSPLGENRGLDIEPVVWKSTLPTGNSSLLSAPTSRTTASSSVGDQSANSTFSTSSRGVPPTPPTRARVPCIENARLNLGSSSSARSPELETPRSCASVTPTDWGSKRADVLPKTSSAFPSKLARR